MKLNITIDLEKIENGKAMGDEILDILSDILSGAETSELSPFEKTDLTHKKQVVGSLEVKEEVCEICGNPPTIRHKLDCPNSSDCHICGKVGGH